MTTAIIDVSEEIDIEELHESGEITVSDGIKTLMTLIQSENAAIDESKNNLELYRGQLWRLLDRYTDNGKFETETHTASVVNGYSYHQYDTKSIDEVLAWLDIMIRSFAQSDDKSVFTQTIRSIVFDLSNRIAHCKKTVDVSGNVKVSKKRGNRSKFEK